MIWPTNIKVDFAFSSVTPGYNIGTIPRGASTISCGTSTYTPNQTCDLDGEIVNFSLGSVVTGHDDAVIQAVNAQSGTSLYLHAQLEESSVLTNWHRCTAIYELPEYNPEMAELFGSVNTPWLRNIGPYPFDVASHQIEPYRQCSTDFDEEFNLICGPALYTSKESASFNDMYLRLQVQLHSFKHKTDANRWGYAAGISALVRCHKVHKFYFGWNEGEDPELSVTETPSVATLFNVGGNHGGAGAVFDEFPVPSFNYQIFDLMAAESELPWSSSSSVTSEFYYPDRRCDYRIHEKDCRVCAGPGGGCFPEHEEYFVTNIDEWHWQTDDLEWTISR